MELTTLSNQEPYLAFYQKVNLSHNYLRNCLYSLHTLQECTELDLSNNDITSLKAFPTLPSLKVLLLLDNKITDYEEVIEVIKRHNLTFLNVKGNPLIKDLLVGEVKNNNLILDLII